MCIPVMSKLQHIEKCCVQAPQTYINPKRLDLVTSPCNFNSYRLPKELIKVTFTQDIHIHTWSWRCPSLLIGHNRLNYAHLRGSCNILEGVINHQRSQSSPRPISEPFHQGTAHERQMLQQIQCCKR